MPSVRRWEVEGRFGSKLTCRHLIAMSALPPNAAKNQSVHGRRKSFQGVAKNRSRALRCATCCVVQTGRKRRVIICSRVRPDGSPWLSGTRDAHINLATKARNRSAW